MWPGSFFSKSFWAGSFWAPGGLGAAIEQVMQRIRMARLKILEARSFGLRVLLSSANTLDVAISRVVSLPVFGGARKRTLTVHESTQEILGV